MSKTLENLMAAFAGESQANRKYLAYAQAADKEGLSGVAKVFRAAAAAQLSVPVITALGAVVFVGEAITLRLVLCSAAILGGIFIVALWGQRHAVPRPDGNRCGQSADTAPRR